jgi:hypothetical protein
MYRLQQIIASAQGIRGRDQGNSIYTYTYTRTHARTHTHTHTLTHTANYSICSRCWWAWPRNLGLGCRHQCRARWIPVARASSCCDCWAECGIMCVCVSVCVCVLHTHTHSHTNTHTHTLSLSLSHTHTHTLSLSHTHTRTYTYMLRYVHTYQLPNTVEKLYII